MIKTSMRASVESFQTDSGVKGEAYLALPEKPDKVAGVVVVHHMPGWDEWTMEVTRKFAHHGFNAIAPNLYFRFGPASPSDEAASARAAGGVADDQVVGDISGAIEYLRALPNSNGKVGLIGFCSGARHAFLAACRLPGVDAIIDCWGGSVIVDDPSLLTPFRPIAPIELVDGLSAPVLGIFGNEDSNPSPDQVNRIEKILADHGKAHAFHRYDGAGHGFFAYTRTAYRPEQALDGWAKILEFLHRNLE